VRSSALLQGFAVEEASRAEELSLEGCDVCIDFSHASQVPLIVQKCVKEKTPLVIGSTGWDNQLDWLKTQIQNSSIGCVYSANYSIGIFLVEHLLKSVSPLLHKISQPSYESAIHEVHHSKKVDSPSGTALQLAKQLHHPATTISSTRCGTVPGTHTIFLDSTDDTIELTHRAKNRSCFAEGALLAAQLILPKQGLYTFNDLLSEAYAL
jgi:4-hydroxy-tetrahydrodipicolinate reductase